MYLVNFMLFFMFTEAASQQKKSSASTKGKAAKKHQRSGKAASEVEIGKYIYYSANHNYLVLIFFCSYSISTSVSHVIFFVNS